MTVAVATVVLMYSIIRFEHMISKYNPEINDYYIDITKGQEANLNEINYRIAFTIEDYYAPRQIKDDERYVKWVFRVFGKKDSVFF